jgi:hypothetical protein
MDRQPLAISSLHHYKIDMLLLLSEICQINMLCLLLTLVLMAFFLHVILWPQVAFNLAVEVA